MHSVQDGQADRREAPAGDIMDHIAAFFDARIAALTGGRYQNATALSLNPGGHGVPFLGHERWLLE